MSILSRILEFFRKQDKSAARAFGGDSVSPQQITITRIFDVGRHKVWDMWTKPEKMAEWWGVPPIAATLDTIKLDVRPGGKFQADMVNGTDGTVLPFRGTYLEVDPPRKLVFTFEDPANPTNTDVETVTVSFIDKAGTTQMTLHQVGHLPVEQYTDGLQKGYSAFFDRMARYLRIHLD